MTLRRRAYCPPRQVEALRDYIWIGDQLPQRTLRSFVHRTLCKRNASSIPGPLEARKRVSKRRMVNVTPVIGPAPVDPGLFAGLGDQGELGNWQWKPTENLPDKINSGMQLSQEMFTLHWLNAG